MKALSITRLKQLKKLKQKKYRDISGEFIVSGLRAVKECLKNPQQCIQLICDENRQDLLLQLDAEAIRHIPPATIPSNELLKLLDEKTPQGLCLVCAKPDTSIDLSRIKGRNYLYVDRINDPGNLGTIIRSASWFAINGILLSPDSADPFQLKVARSTAGTIFNVPLYERIQIQDLESLKKRGYTLYATDINEGEELASISFKNKNIFLFGSEAHGLDKSLQDICDKKCYIKSFGKGESLNLASAASIIMHRIMNP